MTQVPSQRPRLPLHLRAALVTAPLLFGLGATMVLLLQHYSTQTALEAAQRMNLGLARYVVEHQEPGLLGTQGLGDRQRMQALAMHVMKINPAVELYLLDAQGKVIAHALDGLTGRDPVGMQVDMGPMRRLLQATDAASTLLPVWGTDPRQPGRPNAFSVAPLSSADGSMGYLYVVLSGTKAQDLAASLSNSGALRAMALGAALSTLLATLVLWAAWRQLTRPLRQLTNELRSFRDDSADPASDGKPQAPAAAHSDDAGGDEIDQLRHTVRSLQARIAHQFERLQESDRQRRELIGNISHDLRTPLASIQGYVETVLLRGETIDADTRAAYLGTALRHVELLGKRSDDLFELSKLDAGRVQPQPEVFCLAELLQDVIHKHQLAAQAKGVALSLSAGSHTQAKVSADIALIERVLQNLIDNALNYTPAGGTVVLAIEDHDKHLQISVSDNGRGILSEHLPHIFERYWSATHADDATASTSSGLGLAIVKRILDLHGSAVRVHSQWMQGTRFEFLLPQAS